jgi:hypothetical protein
MTAQYVRESPKVNVCFAVLFDQTVGPLFLIEKLINKIFYVAMLQQIALPQVEGMLDIILFRQDGAPFSVG